MCSYQLSHQGPAENSAAGSNVSTKEQNQFELAGSSTQKTKMKPFLSFYVHASTHSMQTAVICKVESTTRCVRKLGTHVMTHTSAMLLQASTTGWKIVADCAQQGGAENVASALHLHDRLKCYEAKEQQKLTMPKAGQCPRLDSLCCSVTSML